jgi:transcriptional regulator GlxA family with amidase domain
MDGCFGSGLASMVDIVHTAEFARPDVDPSIAPLSIDVIGPGRRVQTGAGWTVPVTASLDDLSSFDTVAVAGWGAMSGQATIDALAEREGRWLVRALTRLTDDATTQVAAACTGTFALAEAGLLDHRWATTSWWAGPAFRRRYPRVHLDLDAMVVVDEPVVTAGAAFSHVDLGLALVGRTSTDLAARVANLLVIDERAAQSAYIALDHLAHHDPIVVAFEREVRANLSEPLVISEVAARIGTSRRSLERRTQAALGMSPLTLVRRMRYERAEHLRRTTDLSTEQIARQVGYANASTLSTLLRRAAPSPA